MKLSTTIIALLVLSACNRSNNQIQSEATPLQSTSIQNLLEQSFQPLPNVRDLCISNDKSTYYLTVESFIKEQSAIYQIVKRDDKTKAELMPFSGQYKDMEPALSPDNLRLYYASNRPIHPDSNANDMNLWYVERVDINANWSAPIFVDSKINTKQNEFYPSVAKNGNLYFTAIRTNGIGKEDIFVSYFVDGNYQEPICLSENINTSGYEFNAFIAPDESYLIFSGYNRKDGFGSADLYISFNDSHYNWSKAKNLGSEINTKALDYCPFVDLNEGKIYITSERNRMELTRKFNSDEYLHNINQFANGMSRIYEFPFDLEVIKQSH